MKYEYKSGFVELGVEARSAEAADLKCVALGNAVDFDQLDDLITAVKYKLLSYSYA